MANEFFKTISLQELYSMLKSYSKLSLSVTSPNGSCCLSMIFDANSISYYPGTSAPFSPFIIISEPDGSGVFSLQGKAIRVSAPIFQHGDKFIDISLDSLKVRLKVYE